MDVSEDVGRLSVRRRRCMVSTPHGYRFRIQTLIFTQSIRHFPSGRNRIHTRLFASNLSQVFVGFFFMFLIPVLGSIFLKKWSEETYTYAPTVSPAPTVEESYAPTVSPTSTADAVAATAASIIPAVEYVFGLLGAQSDAVVEYVWSNSNSTATAEFTSSLLGALENSTLNEILGSLHPATLEAIVSAGSQLLQTPTNSTFVTRHLEEEESFFDWITPERWNFIFAATIASLASLPVYTSLATLWLPSSVSTILQFRSGAIGSLRDKSFAKYREARK